LELTDVMHVVWNNMNNTYYISSFAPSATYKLPRTNCLLNFLKPLVCMIKQEGSYLNINFRNDKEVKTITVNTDKEKQINL
jgi:outer membrane protein assembly factor BamE (lipoprotein component of BamABCDE complex)